MCMCWEVPQEGGVAHAGRRCAHTSTRHTARAPAQAEELGPGETTAGGTHTRAQAHARRRRDVHAGRCRQGRADAYLAGRAVGDTGFAITAQVEVRGTSTLVPPARREEAEVAAASVVGLAGMVGNWGEQGDNRQSDHGRGPSGRHRNPQLTDRSHRAHPSCTPCPTRRPFACRAHPQPPARGCSTAPGPPHALGSPSGWR